ncbi:SIMPL domain-containing protein [Halosegnis marinus]|uniref:SIMPL domain-containing protein n=1 Tax=Halosegnis marinus TaxID=3034023 RepID=A0ABD5ZM42_9EURY|nr:SIMPL domain-containing protein [Halosegnis sp. DT85]
MRERTIAVVAVALAVLLAGVGAAAALGGTNSVQTPTAAAGDGSTVSVGASGSAEAAPDRAVVRIAVVATGDTADEARERLAENVSGMRDALRDAGVEDAQVRTTNYDLSENYQARENPDAPGYRAYHGFQVTLDDIDTVGTVIDAAVDGGATRVENVRFTLSDERARELRNEALNDAMTNARAQAETLADAGDLTLGGVHSVATSQGYYGGPVAYETADAGGARTSVESGPVSVQVQVQVTYNATQA